MTKPALRASASPTLLRWARETCFALLRTWSAAPCLGAASILVAASAARAEAVPEAFASPTDAQSSNEIRIESGSHVCPIVVLVSNPSSRDAWLVRFTVYQQFALSGYDSYAGIFGRTTNTQVRLPLIPAHSEIRAEVECIKRGFGSVSVSYPHRAQISAMTASIARAMTSHRAAFALYGHTFDFSSSLYSTSEAGWVLTNVEDSARTTSLLRQLLAFEAGREEIASAAREASVSSVAPFLQALSADTRDEAALVDKLVGQQSIAPVEAALSAVIRRQCALPERAQRLSRALEQGRVPSRALRVAILSACVTGDALSAALLRGNQEDLAGVLDQLEPETATFLLKCLRETAGGTDLILAMLRSTDRAARLGAEVAAMFGGTPELMLAAQAVAEPETEQSSATITARVDTLHMLLASLPEGARGSVARALAQDALLGKVGSTPLRAVIQEAYRLLPQSDRASLLRATQLRLPLASDALTRAIQEGRQEAFNLFSDARHELAGCGGDMDETLLCLEHIATAHRRLAQSGLAPAFAEHLHSVLGSVFTAADDPAAEVWRVLRQAEGSVVDPRQLAQSVCQEAHRQLELDSASAEALAERADRIHAPGHCQSSITRARWVASVVSMFWPFMRGLIVLLPLVALTLLLRRSHRDIFAAIKHDREDRSTSVQPRLTRQRMDGALREIVSRLPSHAADALVGSVAHLRAILDSAPAVLDELKRMAGDVSGTGDARSLLLRAAGQLTYIVVTPAARSAAEALAAFTSFRGDWHAHVDRLRTSVDDHRGPLLTVLVQLGADPTLDTLTLAYDGGLRVTPRVLATEHDAGREAEHLHDRYVELPWVQQEAA